jgi:hypothetical protein
VRMLNSKPAQKVRKKVLVGHTACWDLSDTLCCLVRYIVPSLLQHPGALHCPPAEDQ